MPTIVYYHVENINGTTCMMVTSKRYWDAHHVMDDGSGPDYDNIMAAMNACGVAEAMESVYELASPASVNKIVSDMKERGFDLQQNTAFSKTVGSPR